jgi:hypothetical protein
VTFDSQHAYRALHQRLPAPPTTTSPKQQPSTASFSFSVNGNRPYRTVSVHRTWRGGIGGAFGGSIREGDILSTLTNPGDYTYPRDFWVALARSGDNVAAVGSLIKKRRKRMRKKKHKKMLRKTRHQRKK